ncbi:MAG: endopeptidase La [Desulfobacterales bacterium]
MAEVDRDDLITILEEETPTADIPVDLPLLPVRDVVIFTDMLLPLFVGRESSVRAVEEAVAGKGFVFLCTQKDAALESPREEDLYRVGTVGRVLRVLKLPDGRLKLLIQGVAKGRVERFTRRRPPYRVRIALLQEESPAEASLESEALMRNVREQTEKILSLRGELNTDITAVLQNVEEPGKLADLIASNLRLKIEESQALLEILDPLERLRKVNDLLKRELELSAVQAKIQSEVKDEISKSQRDYYLREQVRAIYRELGEQDERLAEIEDYRRRIKKARMSREAHEEALRQLKRLEQMHPDSAESTVVRTYLDWLVDLPWSRSSPERIDIPRAKAVLDREHYGLSSVKDRIIEHLSIRKLNPRSRGPILCFVGPPGVGKTSLGKAIARALKRKFVRISLGGIRDEAEIRGHRRTYIGAMPGRIVQGLKQAGVKNPVFMMDEIDKLGLDFRGDPSAALLEALDPEQNVAFSDHYLNLPFDLSQVLFLLTANIPDTIPAALLDRMEILTLSGYTEEEKMAIARRHLIPRQVRESGLKSRQLEITDEALRRIVRLYTCEAGLRNLEREIAALCRKVARRVAEGKREPVVVTRRNLPRLLGPPKFIPEMDPEESQVGVATGLAWTSAGGEVLYIEASLMKGKGELIVTGQIGDVMQESARAAVTYARSTLNGALERRLKLDAQDIHIHVPAGAIPKDGPSAGIAMATALVSVLTGRAVRGDVAMTGEVTLRGRVLPVGGLKEKALGALRAGIKTVLLPRKNVKDLEEIPANIRRRLNLVPVQTMEEVLRQALVDPGGAAGARRVPQAAGRRPAKR